MKIVSVLLRLLAAGILFQTLFFKFTAAPESVFIFSTLGVEPYGRWFAGVSELVAGILLLSPPTQILGALMAIAIMTGAIASHLFVLGIVIQNDGGLLFGLAWGVALAAAGILLINKQEAFQWWQMGLRLISRKT